MSTSSTSRISGVLGPMLGRTFCWGTVTPSAEGASSGSVSAVALRFLPLLFFATAPLELAASKVETGRPPRRGPASGASAELELAGASGMGWPSSSAAVSARTLGVLADRRVVDEAEHAKALEELAEEIVVAPAQVVGVAHAAYAEAEQREHRGARAEDNALALAGADLHELALQLTARCLAAVAQHLQHGQHLRAVRLEEDVVHVQVVAAALPVVQKTWASSIGSTATTDAPHWRDEPGWTAAAAAMVCCASTSGVSRFAFHCSKHAWYSLSYSSKPLFSAPASSAMSRLTPRSMRHATASATTEPTSRCVTSSFQTIVVTSLKCLNSATIVLPTRSSSATTLPLLSVSPTLPCPSRRPSLKM
eukprot:scaffold68804_cov61-Phaeocystis_antarctica.AAC.5